MLGEKELRDLLDYELASSKRYRRFFSLVILKIPGKAEENHVFLKGTARESDRLFSLDFIEGGIAVLMPETDGQSAGSAVERYKRMCGNEADMRTGIATFPLDAGTSSELLQASSRRVSKAINSQVGTVVSSD
jgi:hypothetical protein